MRVFKDRQSLQSRLTLGETLPLLEKATGMHFGIVKSRLLLLLDDFVRRRSVSGQAPGVLRSGNSGTLLREPARFSKVWRRGDWLISTTVG